MKKSFINFLITVFIIILQNYIGVFAIENKIAIITYDEILKQAKTQSYDIQIADFDIFIAKQGVRTARSEYFPKINASIGTEYNKNFKDITFEPLKNFQDLVTKLLS